VTPITASPEKELDAFRQEQRDDKAKLRRIEERVARRKARIEEARRDARLIRRLEKANFRQPLRVVIEADRAADDNDLPLNTFRAMCLVVLKKETGLPQRAIFGCDHGSQGGRPPYCHDRVTPDRGRAFLKALRADSWGKMNGVHWTQTTWYEKVFRVEAISHDLTSAVAHMRVCFGDLALLRDAFGTAEAFRRYNGSGAAAEEYRRICMSWMPDMLALVRGD